MPSKSTILAFKQWLRAWKRRRRYTVNPKSLPKHLADQHPQYIVTLTSYGDRIAKTAPLAIASILKGSVLPDRIVLWLAHGDTIPKQLAKLTKNGLEIRFTNDIKSYTKLVPALSAFPNDILITADDDVYYPVNWFAQLKDAHIANPNNIIVHRAHEITINSAGELQPYNDWLRHIQKVSNFNMVFPTGVGGILYPPNSLNELVINEELFLRLAPNGDDIWLWAMAKLQNTKYTLISGGYRDIKCIDLSFQQSGLWSSNSQGGNDSQIAAVLAHFPHICATL